MFFYPPPYNELTEVLPAHFHGWHNDLNSQELAKIIKQRNPKVVVELGSWLGLSTCDIARKLSSDAKVYAVDHWELLPSHKAESLHFKDSTLKAELKKYDCLSTLYHQFLSNVIHENLFQKIIPLKMTTRKGALQLQKKGIEIDLIYVDADHETDAVYQDICDWYPLLSAKGIMCGDDWYMKSVRIAVKQFAKENNLLIDYKTVGKQISFWQFFKNV